MDDGDNGREGGGDDDVDESNVNILHPSTSLSPFVF